MQNKQHSKILATILFALIVLSGCSTYPNKFKCGDARGLGCTMLRDVDTQIDSGKIEEAYKKEKKCRARKCSAKASTSDQSLLNLAPKSKAPIYNLEHEDDIIDQENNLYF